MVDNQWAKPKALQAPLVNISERPVTHGRMPDIISRTQPFPLPAAASGAGFLSQLSVESNGGEV